MQISASINHINLQTHDVERMVEFYRDTLGFEPGYRPPFDSPGCWLYQGENALIHLVKTEREYLNKEPKLNHFAFSGIGLGDYLAKLRDQKTTYSVFITPELHMYQITAVDPDGNLFEVLFNGEEANGVSADLLSNYSAV